MKIETILSISQALILLGGFVLAIRQVFLLGKQISLAAEQLNCQLDWQKKQVTFEYLNKYTNELKDCVLYLQKKIGLLRENGQQINFSKMKVLIKDDKVRTQLYNLVAYFEHLAIGIETEYFDEDLTKKALLNVVVSTFYLINPYLLYRRNETDKNIGGHFESLAKKWELTGQTGKSHFGTG